MIYAFEFKLDRPVAEALTANPMKKATSLPMPTRPKRGLVWGSASTGVVDWADRSGDYPLIFVLHLLILKLPRYELCTAFFYLFVIRATGDSAAVVNQADFVPRTF